MKHYKRKTGTRKGQGMEALPALLFLALMILGSIYYSLLMQMTQHQMIRNAAAAGAMAAVFGGFILFREKDENIQIKPYIFTVLSVAAFCSFLGLVYFDTARFPIWLLGSMLTARFIKGSFAMLYTYGMLVLSMLYYQPPFLELLTFILAGTILSYVSVYLKKASNLIYICVISISMQISILFITHKFVASKIQAADILLSGGCLVGCVLLVYAFGRQFDSIIGKREGDLKELADWLLLNNLQNQKKDDEGLEKEKSKEALAAVITQEHPLRVLLKTKAPRLYGHSESVAGLSRKAAAYLAARQELAYAGGWYHEAEKLFPDTENPLEKVRQDYMLPKELVELIREQNFKEHTPKSMEAVIVILSDQIISTQNYLAALKDTSISMEQIIENAFNSQLKRGTFDKAGITVAQYNRLKQFYLIELT